MVDYLVRLFIKYRSEVYLLTYAVVLLKLSMRWVDSSIGLIFFPIMFLIFLFMDLENKFFVFVILLPFAESEQMPRQIMDIVGVNPINIIFLVILFSMLLEKRISFRQSRYTIPVLLFISVNFLSSLRGWESIEMFMGSRGVLRSAIGYGLNSFLKPMQIFSTALVGFFLFRDKNDISRFLRMIKLGSLMLGVWVIYRGGGTLESMRSLSKVTGLHKNSTGFLFASLLAINLATEDIGDKMERIFSRLLSVFYVAVIMFTFSRQGYITAGLLLTIYVIRKGWKHALCFVLGATLFWSFIMPVEVKRRIYYGTDKGFFMGLSESTLGDFTAGRERAWEASRGPIAENLFFGRGRYAYKRLVWVDNPSLPPHPHNAYIQIFFDSGVFGAFFFIGFYIFLMAKALVLSFSKNKFISSFGYGYFLCVFVYFIQAYTGFRFYPNEESYYIWLFLGVIMWIDYNRKEIEEGVV